MTSSREKSTSQNFRTIGCQSISLVAAVHNNGGNWLVRDGEMHQSIKKLDEKKALIELYNFVVKNVVIQAKMGENHPDQKFVSANFDRQ